MPYIASYSWARENEAITFEMFLKVPPKQKSNVSIKALFKVVYSI